VLQPSAIAQRQYPHHHKADDDEENGPDCTSIEAAKKTHLDSGDDGRSLVVAAIDQRLGGDGKWYETSAMIQEVL